MSWLCRIAWFCKSQSYFRLSLILFCFLPWCPVFFCKVILNQSNKQFSISIHRKVTSQVRKQAILTDSPLQFSISGRWDFHHDTPVCSGLDRNASSRQQKRYRVGCTTIPSRKQMVMFYKFKFLSRCQISAVRLSTCSRN